MTALDVRKLGSRAPPDLGRLVNELAAVGIMMKYAMEWPDVSWTCGPVPNFTQHVLAMLPQATRKGGELVVEATEIRTAGEGGGEGSERVPGEVTGGVEREENDEREERGSGQGHGEGRAEQKRAAAMTVGANNAVDKDELTPPTAGNITMMNREEREHRSGEAHVHAALELERWQAARGGNVAQEAAAVANAGGVLSREALMKLAGVSHSRHTVEKEGAGAPAHGQLQRHGRIPQPVLVEKHGETESEHLIKMGAMLRLDVALFAFWMLVVVWVVARRRSGTKSKRATLVMASSKPRP